MHFQSKVVQLISSYIPKFDAMVLKMKEESINIAPSQTWKFHTSVPLQYLFNSQQDFLPLFHIENRMVLEVKGVKWLHHFS